MWTLELWNRTHTARKAILETWQSDKIVEALNTLGTFSFSVSGFEMEQIERLDIVRLTRRPYVAAVPAERRFYRVVSLQKTYDEQGVYSAQVGCESLERDLRDVVFLANGRPQISARYDGQEFPRFNLDVNASEAGSFVVYRFEGHPTVSVTLDPANVEPTARLQMDFDTMTCWDAFLEIGKRAQADVEVTHVFTTDSQSYFDVAYRHFVGNFNETPYSVDMRIRSASENQTGEVMTAVFPLGAASGWGSTYSGLGFPVTGGTRRTAQVSAANVKFLRVGDHVQLWSQPFTSAVLSSVNSPPFCSIYIGTGSVPNDGSLAGGHLLVYRGTGTGTTKPILNNVNEQAAGTGTAERITMHGTLPLLPDTTSEILTAKNLLLASIEAFNGVTDAASAGSARHLKGRSVVAPANAYVGGWVLIVDGAGKGQTAQVQLHDSNVFTVTAGTAFTQAPDATSTFQLTATPFGSDGTVTLIGADDELPFAPQNADHLVVGLPESYEPLTFGKTMPYRTVVDSVNPAGTAIYCKSAQGSPAMWSHTEAYPHAIRMWESHIGSSMLIPIPTERTYHVNSVDGTNHVVYVRNAVTMPWTTNSRIEVIAFRNLTNSDSFGIREGFDSRSDLMTPQEVAYAGRQRLVHAVRGDRTMEVDVFDAGLFDPQGHYVERIQLGDVILTGGASVTFNDYTYIGSTQATSATGGSVYAAGLDLVTNSLRGHVLTYANSTLKLAVARNANKEIFFKNPNSVTVTTSGWFQVRAGLRVVGKEWSPSEPYSARLRVSNSPPPENRIAVMERRIERVESISGVRRSRDKKRQCIYWNDEFRTCTKQTPPNVFCETSYSNRDGALTAELSPITRGHCGSFRSVERKTNLLQATGTWAKLGIGSTSGAYAASPWSSTPAGGLRSYLATADGIPFRVTQAMAVLEEVANQAAPSYASDFTKAGIRVSTVNSGGVNYIVPSSVTTQEGMVLEFRNESADTLDFYVKWIAFGTRF